MDRTLLRLLAAADSGNGSGCVIARRLAATDARQLRAAHPRAAVAAAALDWGWDGGSVVLRLRVMSAAARATARFGAALPRAACSIVLGFQSNFDLTPADAEAARRAARALPPRLRAVQVGSGVYTPRFNAFMIELCRHLSQLHTLDIGFAAFISNDLITALPPALRVARFSRAHLPPVHRADLPRGLRTDAVVASLPPSLRVLNVGLTLVSAAVRFSHLLHLRMLCAEETAAGDDALASLPPTLVVLSMCATPLSAAARFDHLPRLRRLNVGYTRVGDDALASAPRHLRWLNMRATALSGAARFSHLLRLRSLDLSDVDVSDAAMMSITPSLRVLARHRGAYMPTPVFVHFQNGFHIAERI